MDNFIEEKLISIIKELVGNEKIDINKKTNLISDVGLDSISIISLVIMIEETFEIEIPDHFLAVDVLSDFEEVLNIIITQLECKK